MPVLTEELIEKLVLDTGLISDFDKDCLEGASYDMRLGPQYWRQGEKFILTQERPSIKIEPGDFIILSTLETLTMPLDLVGHNGIMSIWAKRGIVSLFSPQIDPGFEGFLVVPVFNAGDGDVLMSLEAKIFTVEFLETAQPAKVGWSERWGPQKRIPDQYVVPKQVRPNLTALSELNDRMNALKDDFEKVQTEFKSVREKLAFADGFNSRRTFSIRQLGLYLTIFTIIGSVIGYLYGQQLAEFLRGLFLHE